MQALADRLSPYEATRLGRGRQVGLWAALIENGRDAAVPNPDPVSDVSEALNGELARRALLSHLARLEASGPGGTVPSAEVIDLREYRLRRAS
jgi:hypothetical protein